MPKKNSAKKTMLTEPENSVMEEEKPSTIPKRPGNEIDEIFGGKKRKKPETGNAGKAAKDGGEKVKKKKNTDKDKSKVPKENGFADPPSRPRKKIADGLAVYTEEELGIGNPNAGGTRLCPFDCDCCF